jgi:hypothetical protein
MSVAASHITLSSGLHPPRPTEFRRAGLFAQTPNVSGSMGLNRRSKPCRRRASVHGACTVQFLPANPAAEYRLRSGQSKSACGIDRSVRIFRRIAEPSRLDIRGVGESHSLVLHPFKQIVQIDPPPSGRIISNACLLFAPNGSLLKRGGRMRKHPTATCHNAPSWGAS